MKKSLLLIGLLFLFSECRKDDDGVSVPIPDPPATTCADIFDLSRGLLLHYPLDGDGMEVIENNCSGVAVGATPVSDRHGKTGMALYFDPNDYVRACNETLASFGGTENYTFSAWVKIENNEVGGVVISKLNSGVFAGWQLWVREMKLGSYREVPPYSLTTTVTVPMGEFAHIAASFDGENLNLYINGELEASQYFAPHKDDVQTPIIIGGYHRLNEVVPDFEGIIDDVRVYDRALDELEIACLAQT